MIILNVIKLFLQKDHYPNKFLCRETDQLSRFLEGMTFDTSDETFSKITNLRIAKVSLDIMLRIRKSNRVFKIR